MINWIAINSYCLKKSCTSHHIWCAQNVHLQHERKCIDADAIADSTFNNRVTQSGPFTVDASFQFVYIQDLGTIELLPNHTRLHTRLRYDDLFYFLSRCMRCPVWILYSKWPKYNLCISQGSVATVLRWDGQNSVIYVNFLHNDDVCQNYQNWPMFHVAIHNITLAQFF